jgi:predicted dienelactone hydrolase
MTTPNRIDLQRPDAPPLAAPGPFGVGVETLELVNPSQPDVMAALAGKTVRYDRLLVVEHWYPAVAGTGKVVPYRTLLRDGRTEVTLQGSAARGAHALPGQFPLVILSHGFPGNRMLMSHLGENLASKGYRVAAVDHLDSTYGDAAYLGGQAFGSTLVNRPLDTAFVAGALGGDSVAIVGYSMGGYGALISGGAQIARAALTSERAGPVAPLWAQHCETLADPRLKAIVTFGPWGRQMGLWDAEGMAELSVPLLVIAGGRDDVSGYDNGMRLIFDEAVGVERHLLTFEGAGHNAGAPFPAPLESWAPVPWLDFVPFEHYSDRVWDTVRMNNIAQHYVTGFLDRHLKGVATILEGGLTGIRFESRP